MALIKCHECGAEISTEATSCPKCGAKRKLSINGKMALIYVAIFFLVFWFIHNAFNDNSAPVPTPTQQNESTEDAPSGGHGGDSAKSTPPDEKKIPVDFSRPLVTGFHTLVCPISVELDNRAGYGLQAVVKAHLSIFGHQEAIEKSGCEEWREGIDISISDEGQREAKEAQSKGLCEMVQFGETTLILSCDLKNEPIQSNVNSTTPASAPQNTISMDQSNQGPSFNCAKARTHVEIMICGDDDLSTLDRKMLSVYRGALASASPEDAAKIKSDGVLWRTTIRDKCDSVECLRSAYTNRIGEMSQAL